MAIKSEAPIFKMYTTEELCDELDYEELYVCSMKYGAKPVSHRFRKNACKLLKLPMEELFGPIK